ncbi:MAG: flavodoxin family protein [Nitriliruptor sp.]|nr:MAG: flavodoxin family protein [Nitriliruptor sp.]
MSRSDDEQLRCLAINCTLKASGPSSTQVLLDQAVEALDGLGVACSAVRAVALDIRPGVTSDEGDGDAWPAIRDELLAADILLLGTPIWTGGPSSVCRRVLERCDAFLSDTDDLGRMVTFGKVAGVVVTGNEDGAHNVVAQLYQALADCGFTIPTNAATYWVGEAMGSVNYRDLDEQPDKVAETTQMMATNLVHVARLLKASPYPGPGTTTN